MSDTPNATDDCMKLLDNGWAIGIFKNGLGSYTAYAYRDNGKSKRRPTSSYGLPENQVTDDFTPSQALYRLTEKVLGRIA